MSVSGSCTATPQSMRNMEPKFKVFQRNAAVAAIYPLKLCITLWIPTLNPADLASEVHLTRAGQLFITPRARILTKPLPMQS
jgi:hypothetical protein